MYADNLLSTDFAMFAALFFFSAYRSVIVPSSASAAMPMVSDSVGCG